MRAPLFAVAALALAACSGSVPCENSLPGGCGPTPAPAAPEAPSAPLAVEVIADSIVVDDPARRLAVALRYPVVQGGIAGREAINRQLRETAEDFWRGVAPSEPVAADAPAHEATEVEGHFEVHHADSDLVSVFQWTWAYTGGAHGNSFFHPQTYDARTGRPLALGDVIRVTPEALTALRDAVLVRLVGAAAERFETDRGDAREQLWLDDVTATQEAFEGIWTVGAEGLTVHYAPYAVGPYAAGPWEVTVPYEDLEGHLTPVTERLRTL